MTTTNELELTHLATSQEEQPAAVNAALDTLDSALAGTLPIALADADYSLDTANDEHLWLCWRASGTLTADRTVTVPLNKGLHIAENSTDGGFNVLYKTSTGTGVSVQPAERVLVYVDGTNVIEIAGLGADGYPYDQAFFVGGKPGDGSYVLRVPMVRAAEFPIDLDGSYAIAATAPAAQAVFSIRKNGVEFATATFAAASSTATFSAASVASFSPGDVLSVVAPSPQDANLYDVGFSIKGTRF